MPFFADYRIVVCFAAFVFLTNAASADDPSSKNGATESSGTPSASQIQAPSFATPGGNEWPSPGANTALTRYSTLADINSDNVAKLASATTFSMGVNRGQEAAPLVVGHTLYVVTPYPNILYALDLSKPGNPLKWKFEPHPLAAAQGVAEAFLIAWLAHDGPTGVSQGHC